MFGITMTSWALGSIIGPAVTGPLTDPCATFPSLSSNALCHGPASFLRQFPFAVAYLLIAAVAALSTILSAFCLSPPEVVRSSWEAAVADAETEAAAESGSVDDPLLHESTVAGDKMRRGRSKEETGAGNTLGRATASSAVSLAATEAVGTADIEESPILDMHADNVGARLRNGDDSANRFSRDSSLRPDFEEVGESCVMATGDSEAFGMPVATLGEIAMSRSASAEHSVSETVSNSDEATAALTPWWKHS